jgi:hypothetical protein
MPIVDLIKRNPHAFAPDEIKIIVTAFEDALRELRLVDRQDPATLLVANRIIALAQQGERDPIRLRHGALQGLRTWMPHHLMEEADRAMTPYREALIRTLQEVKTTRIAHELGCVTIRPQGDDGCLVTIGNEPTSVCWRSIEALDEINARCDMIERKVGGSAPLWSEDDSY